jgi:hypothetical protein
MAITTTVTKHGFLAPGHNAWALWSADGSATLTNPGASHRVLESLAYAIDTLTHDGWRVKTIYVEQGTPTLVFLSRDEVALG